MPKNDKDVIISVVGTQSIGSSNPGVLELITEGQFYKENSKYFAVYNETEITGMEGTITTVGISPDMVTLTRVGSVNSQLIFQKGQKHVSYYDTAQGAFTIGVFTDLISIDVNEHGGEIKIDYHLEIDNAEAGKNDFHITIREVDSDV